jgi:endonuclease-3
MKTQQNVAMPDKRLVNQAQRVYRLLERHYGLPEWRQPLPAVDELVSTILSQNTNDSNRDLAFERLKARFPSWETVRDGDIRAVIEAIRPAGLANQKGPRIQSILAAISAERGSLDLDFLKELPREEARAWLSRFKGVGPKTAAIVMQFSLGMPAFPVDTHVHRVSGRLGLRPEKMSAEAAHDLLEALFQEEQYGPGHLNLIRLGREICAARQPRCEVCPLREECEYYRNLVDWESAGPV